MKQIPKHRSRLIWTLLLVLVVPLSWYCKQPDARIGVDNNKTGKIYGKVIDKKTGEALAGVNIIVYGTSQGAATNMNGEYSITKVKPGKYTVSASMIGYVNEIDKNIVVLNKTSRELNFELISKSIQGETIVISAKDAKGNIFKPATLAKSEKEAIPSPPAPPLPPELEVEFDSGPAPVDGFEAISKAIKYPTSAKKAGLECKVIASIYINENGDVIANKIQKTTSLTTKSTSFIPDTKAITDYEKAAIDALSSLKWIPAMNNKQAVGVWVTIPVSFRLPDKQGATQMKIQGKKSNTKFTASTSWPDDSGQIKPKDTQTSKEFVPYDTPPEPIGGMKTIAENLVYPEKAKEANEQGTVIIQAKINVNGNVEATEILRSFGSKVCDEAALKAIMLTKWTPAKQRDKDVSVWITVPIEFKLDNNK
jgi:TonB family protein